MPRAKKKPSPKAVPESEAHSHVESMGVNENGPTLRTFDENHPYWKVINQVVDPELGVGIADMGIVYDVQQKDGVVDVKMTLTSMGCPAGPDIVTNLDGVLRMEPGVKDVLVEVVWDPMWTPDMMKPELREMLMGGGF